MANPDAGYRKPPLVFRILGWLLGALSVLNLIRDLTPLELYGLAREWIGAYGQLVSSVGDFAFGWLRWGWVAIDKYEYHVLVLIGLITGAMIRASYADKLEKEQPQQEREATRDAVIILAAIAVLVLLLVPTPYSIWLSGGGFAAIAYGAITAGGNGQPDIYPADLLREFVIILTVVMFVIIANYSIFAT